HRHRENYPGRIPRPAARPVPRRQGRGGAGPAQCRRRVPGARGARQARRKLHAARSGPRSRGRAEGAEDGGEMIPELGQFALALALAVALVQAFFPLAGAHSGNLAWMSLARPAAQAHALLVAFAFGCLAWSFV